MPSALNAFFKTGSSGSRRSSASSSLEVAPSSSSSGAQQSSGTSKTQGPAVPARLAAGAQRSVPPIETSQSALENYQKEAISQSQREEVARRSESFPSIEIVSPTGSTARRLWGPDTEADEAGGRALAPEVTSPSIVSPSTELVSRLPGGLGSIDQRTPIAVTPPNLQSGLRQAEPSMSSQSASMAEPPVHSDDESDDPLYSLTKPIPRKPARSAAGPGGKRGAKVETPDRHDIMRRAMAEATKNDSYVGSVAADSASQARGSAHSQTQSESLPSRGVQAMASTRISPAKATAKSGHAPTSSSQATMIDHERPGDGSLSINHFTGGGGDDNVLDSDLRHDLAADASALTDQSLNPDKARSGLFGKRPKMGSRASSYTSDVSANHSLDDSVTPRDYAAGDSAKNSPVKAKSTGHSRYATTGTAVDPAPNKQPSLVIPGAQATKAKASPDLDARHRMHESSSTGSLLVAPLNRLRRPSDAGKKAASPSGGIAGALAASGMAGMGVGHSDLLRQSQIALASPQQLNKTSPSKSRPTSGTYREFVGASQGGVYRDPNTGMMIEHGPDSLADGSQMDMLRSRSATVASNVSHESSDASAGSGLSAAADFARVLQQRSPHLDNHVAMSPGMLGNGSAPGMLPDRARQLTPNGIGAVGGLSPSGLGERVELGMDDLPWPGADVDAQITGFAVASSKRNAEFHALFTSVPEDDYLIEDYGCALVREILIQGRIYVSENHICFYANIFGWITSIVVPFGEIVSIEKRMTAYVIPNAIQVATLHSKHTFASFLSRDTTFDVVVNIWKLSHPTLPTTDTQAEVGTDEESVDGIEAETEAGKAKPELAADGVTPLPVKRSKRNIIKKKLGIKDAAHGSHGIAAAVVAPDLAAAIARGKSPGPSAGKRQAHRKTSCTCEKDKKHFSTVALDTTFPTVPEKLYNLIFTSGFMKEFWTDNQKLTELQMSDWAPNAANNNMLSRDISYIKPLSGGFGPKQTKCVLTDENEHVDFDEYITTITTTRTPEVPSGGSFSVKTRTCITWAGGNVSRILVTCMVDWTGRSMVKGIIDRASIDGQKQYYKDLDAAIRSYIKEHASEFREEGEDPEETAAAVDETANAEKEDASGAEAKAAESADGISKYLSMVRETGSTFADMVTAALDMLSDLLGGVRPQVIVLGFIVILLAVSNLFAMRGGSGRDPLDPHRLIVPSRQRAGDALQHTSQYGREAAAHVSTSAEAVALAVRDVLKDYFDPHGQARHSPSAAIIKNLHEHKIDDPGAEIARLLGILDEIEARVAAVRGMLTEVRAAADEKKTPTA